MAARPTATYVSGAHVCEMRHGWTDLSEKEEDFRVARHRAAEQAGVFLEKKVGPRLWLPASFTPDHHKKKNKKSPSTPTTSPQPPSVAENQRRSAAHRERLPGDSYPSNVSDDEEEEHDDDETYDPDDDEIRDEDTEVKEEEEEIRERPSRPAGAKSGRRGNRLYRCLKKGATTAARRRRLRKSLLPPRL